MLTKGSCIAPEGLRSSAALRMVTLSRFLSPVKIPWHQVPRPFIARKEFLRVGGTELLPGDELQKLDPLIMKKAGESVFTHRGEPFAHLQYLIGAMLNHCWRLCFVRAIAIQKHNAEFPCCSDIQTARFCDLKRLLHGRNRLQKPIRRTRFAQVRCAMTDRCAFSRSLHRQWEGQTDSSTGITASRWASSVTGT